MQVLVSQLVLPGGWCSFCFYLVSCSSHCSCYLYWNCGSLFILAMVGLFCNQNFLLLNCLIMYLGGCCISLLWWALRWWYLWGGSLCAQWSYLPVWWEPFLFSLLSNGRRFLCVASLRGHWVPANLFLLDNWAFHFGLWSLVRVTWSGWKWGHFKIFLWYVWPDLYICFYLLFWGSCDGSYDLKYWRFRWSVALVAWKLE